MTQLPAVSASISARNKEALFVSGKYQRRKMNRSMEICVSVSFHSPRGNLQTQYITVKAPVGPGRAFLPSQAECFTTLAENLLFKRHDLQPHLVRSAWKKIMHAWI